MPISNPNSGTSHILSDNRRIDDLEERSCVEIGLKDESLTDMYRADEVWGLEALATVEEHKVRVQKLPSEAIARILTTENRRLRGCQRSTSLAPRAKSPASDIAHVVR